MRQPNNRPGPSRRFTLLALAALLAVAVALAVAGGAPAQDLEAIQSKIESSRAQLDEKQSQLQHAKDRAGVLSTTIQKYGDQLDQLRGEVATLQNRIAIVQTQLRKKEAELKEAKARLAALREHLKRSLRILRERLVAIYKSNNPDAMTVILNSRGFDDMVSRYDYLQRIQSQDTSIAVRVKRLRNEEKETVERVRAARNAIADKKAELEQTQAALVRLQARTRSISRCSGRMTWACLPMMRSRSSPRSPRALQPSISSRSTLGSMTMPSPSTHFLPRPRSTPDGIRRVISFCPSTTSVWPALCPPP